MLQQISPNIYQYSKAGLIINNINYNSAVIFNSFPEYKIDNNVYSIYYEQGSKNNYIKYKDGSLKELEAWEPFYEEQFSKVNAFAFECQEAIFTEQLNIPSTFYKITLYNIFCEKDLAKRELLKEQFELERQSYKLTSEKVFAYLDKYKKKKLAQTDWTQTLDIQAQFNKEQKEQWTTYRQALRDLDKVENPFTDSFIPIAPSN